MRLKVSTIGIKSELFCHFWRFKIEKKINFKIFKTAKLIGYECSVFYLCIFDKCFISIHCRLRARQTPPYACSCWWAGRWFRRASIPTRHYLNVLSFWGHFDRFLSLTKNLLIDLPLTFNGLTFRFILTFYQNSS